MNQKMKTTIALLTTALMAPAAILFGLAVPIAFGATAILGVSSIALGDYAKPSPEYHRVVAKSKQSETHPLAA